MKRLLCVFAALVVGLLLAVPARAQYYYGPRYGYPYVTPYERVYPYSYYAPPVLYPRVVPYTAPYYWSAQFNVTPYGGAMYYGRYYPWSNRYYYRYHIYGW